MCAALATLLTVLSTASYRFIWATTLLAPDTFVWLTQAIGWLPGLAGFPLPDAATVLASDGVQTLPAAAQVQWSLWLIGVVVVYGVLPGWPPRCCAWSCCGAGSPACASTPRCPATPRCATGWNPPWSPPAWTVRRPAARAAPVRAGACRAGRPSGAAGAGTAHRPALAAGHNPGIQIAGRLDTREERRRILDALADAAASRLLIACDARQTPDRGTLTLIAELAAHAARVWLLLPAHEDGPARAPLARAARGAGPARAGRAGGIRQRAGLAGDRTWLIP